MAAVKGTIGANGGTDGIIIVIYKSTAPSVEVDRIFKPFPHSAPYNFQFSDVVPGNYLVNIHWTTDGTTLGALVADYWYPAVSSTGGVGVVQFLGGTDVADGATEWNNADLAGKELLLLYEEGTRPLRNGYEWEPIATGGVRLLAGRTFSDEGVWTVMYAETVISSVPVAGGAEFTEISELPGNTTLSSAEVNKWVIATGIASSQTLGLPPAGSISSGGYMISHDGRGPINVRITATGTNTIRFRGQNLQYIDLGIGEKVTLIKSSNGWRVRDYAGQWDRLGDIHAVRDIVINQLPADGQTLYDGNQYRRIYEWLLNLPSNRVVNTVAAWNTTAVFNGQTKFINRGLFFLDIVAKTFRTPDMRGKYLWFLDVGIPGQFDPWQIGDHTHPLPIQDFGTQDRQSIVVNANADEGLSETNRTGLPGPAGASNHVERIGLIPVVLI